MSVRYIIPIKGIESLFFAVLLGAVVATGATLFQFCINFIFNSWQLINQKDSFFTNLGIPFVWMCFIAPILGAPMIIYLVKKLPEYRQYSPADTIAVVNQYNGKIDLFWSFWSVFITIFSLGFGYSVGLYGPTVQLGATLGQLLHHLKTIRPAYLHISIGCAVAAAIAAIFHTPIGAVIFVHEFLFRFFSIRAFAPIAVSTVTSYAISEKVFNKTTIFSPVIYQTPEVGTYFIIGLASILAGFVAVMLIKSIDFFEQLGSRFNLRIEYRILCVAGVTGVLGMFVPEMMGSGELLLGSLLSNNTPIGTSLLIVLLIKLFATSFALGFGVPGGITGPSLVLGGILGGAIALIFSYLFPAWFHDQIVVIVATMAAVSSAVVGTPIAMLMIVVEMTDNFVITSYVLLAVVIANVVSFRILGISSFFDGQLKARGIDMSLGRDSVYIGNRQISNLINKKFVAFNKNIKIDDAELMLLAKQETKAYVTDDEDIYLGSISLSAINLFKQHQTNTAEVTVFDVLNTAEIHLYTDTSIWHAMELMEKFDGEHVAVLNNASDFRLLGIIYEKQLISTYLSTIRGLREQENSI